jgi:GDP-L-fucose synthase
MIASYSLKGKRVWVAGHRGMAGAAIVRRLQTEECMILTIDKATLDLRNQVAVHQWINDNKPDALFLAAAKVGGIYANSTLPADFLYDNLMIEANIIHAAWQAKVEKLLFLGSSCIYPRDALQPMSEECLLTGALEPTNEWYAIAKISGVKLCQAYRQQYDCRFISIMPTNLYGQGDNFHPTDSHVPAALLRRFHEAKTVNHTSVTVWGSGTPQREFMDVDDLADACVFLMQQYDGALPINVGSGAEIKIRDFAYLMRDVVGYKGEIIFDAAKPDGAPRKLLNCSRLHALGWQAKIPLKEGLHRYYAHYLKDLAHAH